MTSRERVIRTLHHQEIDRVPRQLWYLPGISLFRKRELDAVLAEYPDDFIGPYAAYGVSHYAKGAPNEGAEYTDEWGCTWKAGEPGVIGEVKEPRIRGIHDLKQYELPWELLDNADFSGVNASCAATDKFVLAGTSVRPFERMQFLRGTEDLMVDIALEEPLFLQLRDRLHEFYKRELALWAETNVDGVSFMDDWGTQKSLLISPDAWRKYFKPLYKDYVDILHQKGKYAFMHSDGNITAIYPDLIEVGVDALNSQLFCMDMDELGRRYAGKITFWGEIDRQFTLPFGTENDVRAAVDQVAAALMPHRTGIIAQCEWGIRDPAANIRAVFDQWNRQ